MPVALIAACLRPASGGIALCVLALLAMVTGYVPFPNGVIGAAFLPVGVLFVLQGWLTLRPLNQEQLVGASPEH